MKLSKKFLAPAAAALIIGGASATALAATSTTGNGHSLAAEIAQKFGLDQSQVQSVIDQHRSEVSQDREARYEQRLANAVTNGQLSSTQKESVLAEHNKLIGEIQSATSGDRRQTLKNVRQEAQTWASQNNIDAKWLLPVRRMGPPAQSN